MFNISYILFIRSLILTHTHTTIGDTVEPYTSELLSVDLPKLLPHAHSHTHTCMCLVQSSQQLKRIAENEVSEMMKKKTEHVQINELNFS